ncbi:uncharacterized protein LOC126660537 [Mercurialis annua]|uniref:uncharacterized protein LOC126660537 n=1 Tax=Mercurialis annua TaxID=3986 RepID=UPI00215F98F6|nr:uncharacterized protein LOC126660537 [Mercurialis annua]
MEKPQIEIPKTLNSKRWHLQSQTYNKLVHILSQCYKHPELCKTPKFTPQELTITDEAIDGNEPKEASEKEVPECSLVTPHGADHNDSVVKNSLSINENVEVIGSRDGGLSDTQAAIYEIENLMTLEDVDAFKEKNPVVDGGGVVENNILEDKGFCELQQLLMDDLEPAIEGNEKVGHDKQCSDDAAAFFNNRAEHLGPQPTVREDGRCVDLQEVDKEYIGPINYENIQSSLDKSMTCEVPKSIDNSEEKSLLPRTNELRVNHEMQQKEMELQISVCANDAAVDSSNLIKDGEMEEGEIAGVFKVSDRLVDTSLKDSAAPQEQNMQLSNEAFDRNKHPYNDKKEPNRKDTGSVSTTSDMVKEVEAKDVRIATSCKRKVVVYEDAIFCQERVEYKKQKTGQNQEPKKDSRNKRKKKDNDDKTKVCSNNLPLSAKKSDQDATDRQEITCKEKLQQDTDLCIKKKRGPASEKSKQKKKDKKRKKRAELNRELGVKRLKLRPVEKPKPVVFCRHYMRGRCHEGENCKFSHDTIPLTKSMPCCHFARNSCLKGDDCPFDHQLSKYPCTNYASTGSCSRGKDCSFSHTLPLKEDLPPTSTVCTPDLKPPSLPHASNSKKQHDSGGTSHHTAKASSNTGSFLSQKSAEKNVPNSSGGLHTVVPKGISFLSTGKSSVAEPTHSTPSSSYIPASERFKTANQMDQRASGATNNSNEIPKTTPAPAMPKGINFLSFGKASSEVSSTRKLSNGPKSSLSSSLDGQKQSSLIKSNDTQADKETSRSMLNSTPWLHGLLQKTEFSASPLKSNKLSFGGSIENAKNNVPSSSTKLVDGAYQASEISPLKHQNMKTISQGQSASPLGSGRSAEYLSQLCSKNTPNSSQKALLSTLAFAAKVESQMKMKQSTTGTPAITNSAHKETKDSNTSGSSQTNSANATKILNFLSSVSDKMKQ